MHQATRMVTLSTLVGSLLLACSSSDDGRGEDVLGGSGSGANGVGGSTQGGQGAGSGNGASTGVGEGGSSGEATGGSSGMGGTGGQATGGQAGSSGTGGSGGQATGGQAGSSGTGGSGGYPSVVGTPASRYGVKCDGSSDDRNAIQAAFNDVASWTNQTLIFPAGQTCIISGGVTLSGNNWTIEGNDATIKAKDGMCLDGCGPMMMLAETKSFTIHRLHTDGNRSKRSPAEKWSGHNVIFQGAQNGTIKSVQWKNATTDNAYIRAKTPSNTSTFSKDLSFIDCQFKNGYRNSVSVIEGWGITFKGTCSGEFSGTCSCQFTTANGTAPESGIDWEPNAGSASPGVDNGLIDGCLFENNAAQGCLITAINGTRNVTVKNSIFRGNGTGSETVDKGAIHVGGAGSLVENNWFAQQTGTRFALIYVSSGKQSNTRTTEIKNNNFDGQPPLATDVAGRRVVHFGNFGDDTAGFSNNTMTNIGTTAGGDWCMDWKSHSANIVDNKVDGVVQSPNPGCP